MEADEKNQAITEISEDEVARSWDLNADRWAEQVRKGWDAYREYYNNPAFFEFVGDLSGKYVLDAGCGEGYNTRIFARRGATMVGVDLSERMISFAREEEQREPLGIRYERASYNRLAIFPDQTFDAVVSTMALMDGPDFSGAMRELRRVLKPAAPLAFSILHPCFLTRGIGWTRDQNGKTRLMMGGYFDGAPLVECWNFSKARETDQSKFRVPRFDRTLSFYINSVVGAGFKLEEIHEPRPTEEACEKHPSLRNWRDSAATFLYVRATKPR